MRKERSPKDLKNQKFGRLTPLSWYKDYDKGDVTRWICKCDCGNEIHTSSHCLTRGSTKSCGCLFNEYRFRFEEGDSIFRVVFGDYKRSANEREYSFNISFDLFKFIITKDCEYCGSKPRKRTSKGCRGFILINGIDRVNNSIGYEIDNCITSCKQCNIAKGKLGQEEFKIWIKKLINFNKDLR